MQSRLRGRYVKTDNIFEFASQIVEHAAKPRDLDLIDSHGNTPLHLAVQQNNHEAAFLLIKNGADINARDEKGRTPLHRAAGYNAITVARLLIESGADIFAKDEEGLTPPRMGTTREICRCFNSAR